MVGNNSCSINGTERVGPLELWVYVLFSSVQIIIGSTANAVVIVTIFVSRQLRQRSEDRLILNLAITNFLSLTTVLPWSIHINIQQLNNVNLAIFSYYCALIALVATTESNTILCIVIDRFVAVVYPLCHPNIINTGIMIVLSWGTAIILQVGIYLCFKFSPYKISRISIDIIIVTYNLFFLAIIVTLYAIIFYHTLKQGRNILNQRRSVGAAKDEFSSHLLLKITLRTFVLMCLFYTTYLPWAIYIIHFSLVLGCDWEDYGDEIIWIETVFFINSCINPFVYALRTKRFKKEFRKKIWSRSFHHTAN